MDPDRCADLATMELRVHLRRRQRALVRAAQVLARDARTARAETIALGCGRVSRRVERLGQLLDRLFGTPPSTPRGEN